MLRHGPPYVSTMRRGLEDWLEWNKASSLDEYAETIWTASAPASNAFIPSDGVATLPVTASERLILSSDHATAPWACSWRGNHRPGR